MSLKTLLDVVLRNEPLTRGLEDPEARMLVEWLVERTEAEYRRETNESKVRKELLLWCRRARTIARFVALWCHERSFAAALQLAATERFTCPLPVQPMEACDLLGEILVWEDTPANEDGMAD